MNFESEKRLSSLENDMLSKFEFFRYTKDFENLFDLARNLENVETNESEKISMHYLSDQMVHEVIKEDCDENSRDSMCDILRKLEIPFEQKEVIFESFSGRKPSDFEKEFLIDIVEEDMELLDKYFPNEVFEIPDSRVFEEKMDEVV
jgi:hypothetical protein